jgi:hypothetical protein
MIRNLTTRRVSQQSMHTWQTEATHFTYIAAMLVNGGIYFSANGGRDVRETNTGQQTHGLCAVCRGNVTKKEFSFL